MSMLRVFGFGYLLPMIETSEEPIDIDGSPCSFTRRPSVELKCTYRCFSWLGLAVGLCFNVRPLEDADYQGYITASKCPNCEEQMYGNKVGKLWCECGHRQDLFFRKD